MTLSDTRKAASPTPQDSYVRIRSWLRDLAYGLRFAAFGGREGWIRNALTAAGVGLGVALLLIASSVPHIMDNRDRRAEARAPSQQQYYGPDGERPGEPSDTSVLWADASTEYRTDIVNGLILRADGARPKLPPGVDRMPGAGEMFASPALAELLASDEGRLLAQRMDYRMIGAIGDTGLLDPGEYFFYAGSSTLTLGDGVWRTASWGGPAAESLPYDPVLIVVITLACVVLLVPVAVFIATAARFGGDRRDRRLAALRLVGADAWTTRRIAAGEALFGSALGLTVGLAVFALARLFAGSVRVWELSAFPADVVPLPRLAAALLLAVPVTSVAVSLFALRSVVVEPLGVVRNTALRRRRFWWRPLVPLAGLLLLLNGNTFNSRDPSAEVSPFPIAAGAILTLLGITAMLPWVVEALVGRLRGGPLSWQLATRRLQLSSGAATRAVSGIMVAVAGAIALQMLFAGMHDSFNRTLFENRVWDQLNVSSEYPSKALADRMTEELGRSRGAKDVIATIRTVVSHPNRESTAGLTVGDCTALRKLAEITSCADGDTFVVHAHEDRRQNDWIDTTARKGGVVLLGDEERAAPWTLPVRSPTVLGNKNAEGWENTGVYATFGAIDVRDLASGMTLALVPLNAGVPDAPEHIRNAAAGIDPALRIWSVRMTERDARYESLQTGLLAAASATLGLIAASMLVSQIEQLRERRRLLSALVAFGTPRTVLAWSVLWQTAVPVVLGTVVAVAGGLALGAAMLALIGKEVTRWWIFLPVAGVGAGVILLVTLVSLPPLWRMMRPEGLRTE
ncbi:FtsX-like permease family protein [Streptomyces albipurpureus]|uniref:ABC transporter permease n=1 Tax=Streptomyces albipurpureus TaxID=2897419 RepID=A0ABT0UP45_9ACTN|nr:FtsX-like permease family protein [Streptomyces sp. CWNU-1]MCM2389153.1 ABC transporter permease [Streptomyces sp. CWNU-1]